MQVGPVGSGSLEGTVRHVRTFGPTQRAEVALCGGEGKTFIEIDAPGIGRYRPVMSLVCDRSVTGFLPRRIEPVISGCAPGT